MKTNNEKTVAVLNGLIEINNDRVNGYELAAKETDDDSLKGLFNDLAGDSRKFRQELSGMVTSIGGQPTKGTSVSGKVYRAWMDVKAAITAKDKKQILSSCEFGEDVALESYKTALNSDNSFSDEQRTLVQNQKENLQRAHNTIKELRDTVYA
jgi:uncharacterized protein (TIGR02284 family)